MSSINPVGQSLGQAAQQTQNKPSPAKAAVAAAIEEANETQAQTRQEAAKGDQVAIRKLARQHKNHAPHTAPAPSQPAATSKRGLNVSA